MIHWPDEQRLNPGVRELLVHFRATSAAAQLEAHGATWELEASSWVAEWPERLIWRNDEGHEAVFVREEDGTWRFMAMPNEPVKPNPMDPLTALGRAW